MENQKLALLQKRGMSTVDNYINIAIGAVIVLSLLVALAPTFFSGLGTGVGGLQNTTANPDAPSWVGKVAVIIVGAGIVLLIWRLFSHK